MADQPCGQCGKVHKATQAGRRPCTGHISGKSHPERAGEPCTAGALLGLDVCHAHGGKNPAARKAGQARHAAAQAERVLAKFATPVQVDPAEELLDLIYFHAGYVRYLRERVNELDDDELTWGITRNKTGGDDHGLTEEAKPNEWLRLLEVWTDKHARLLVEALKLNLDERRVRVAEHQGEKLYRALEGVLLELGHNLRDPDTAQVVERHLVLARGA